MWKIFKTIEGSSHSNGGEDMVLNGLPVEVEGGELLLQHSNGSVGVVPKRHASYVKNLASTKSPFLDQYMDSLQKMGTYANNGTIVPLYASEQVLDSNDDDKKAIAKHAPGLKGRYGDDMRYLDVYRDKNYKAHEYGYGSIEYMQPWQNSVRYEDKYSYPNHNYGSGKDMIVYNPDKSDIGDVILDASSHGFRDDPRHTELAKTIISESSNDIDHFYKLSGMKDSRGDFEMNWVDGKIRSYMAQNGDVPVRESVKKDYANEYFTDTEKIAVEKYYNDVIRKDPSVVNTIARQRVKLSDGGIIGDPPKLEDGGIIDGGRQLVKRKPTPTRKPNIDSLYNYSDTEKAFLEKQYPYAKAVGDKYDIDPVLLLTHTGTETTFNNNKYLNNNIFGLKAPKDTAGQPIGNYKYEKTGEWMSDDKQDYRFKTVHSKTYNEKRKEWYYEVDEPFVTYDSMEDAYESLLNNMSKSSRYAPVLAKKDDANAYFDALGKSGFSTSKTYGETLKSNYDKTRAYVQYRIENKPKLEDGAVIGDPLKMKQFANHMFGYEYKPQKKQSFSFSEPSMVNDHIPTQQSKPTWLQEGVRDLNMMADSEFENKYKVHKHGWALMNSPEYAAEIEAGIDKNNPNAIDYPHTSYLSRNYDGNPNLAYARSNQSGTDMIKGMEMAHMEAVGAALPIPGIDAMGSIPSIFKFIKGAGNLAKGFKGASNISKEIGVAEYLKGLKKILPEKEYIKRHLGKEIKKLSLGLSPSTTKALGKLDDNIAKKMLFDYRFGDYPSIKDFRINVKKAILESERIKKINPDIKFDNADLSFLLNRPSDLSKYKAAQEMVNTTIKSQAKMMDFIDSGYKEKMKLISTNKTFKNIAEESPQYTDIIYNHLKNPQVSDDIFVNNLVKQSNTFTRSISKEPINNKELLTLKGKSLLEGNRNTIDVEGFPVSNDYGAYRYKIEPNAERMSKISSLPIEQRWEQRLPKEIETLNPNIDLKEGWLNTTNETYRNWYKTRMNRNRQVNNVPPIRHSIPENAPIKYYHYPQHNIFSSSIDNQVLEGFDVSKMNIPTKDIYKYIPGFTKGFAYGGIISNREIKPKLEDGAVIGDPLKGIRKMTGMFGYEYMSPKKESPIFKEPGMANDNVPKQSTPTYLQQGVADVNIMPDKDFETKYKVHKHGWSLMNSPEYAAEVEAGIDKNNPNTIDYQKTSFLNRTYEGNPNLAYTRTNQSGTDMIKGMEQAHMNVVGAVLPIPFLDAPIMGKSIMGSILKASKGFKGANTAAKEIGVVDDIAKVSKQPWQMQEMPGLHLQSTMENGAISKIVDKTGKINTEQAFAIIAKESGGAEKLAIIKQGFGDNIPSKMDFNEFRKVVQDQLIPLEKQFSELRSDYGINSIGYGDITDIIKKSNGTYDIPVQPIENQTLILGNKGKFGRGSSAHGNPEETLGHAHFLRDAETPDVLTVTQIQSDAFQGTHRVMPKTHQEALEKVNKLKEEGVEIKSMFGDGKESSNAVLANYEKHLQLDEASAKNFTQKELLAKNHQERYLQELVDYAGKRGDVNKVRVPTPNTANKVQHYLGFEKDAIAEKVAKIKRYEGLSAAPPEIIEKLKSEITILKKYSEQPKTIKKLFGIEPKIVTDSKGNTWYEFDIPKKFKEGKGEIKAFSTIPAIGTAGAIGSTTNNNKQNGKNNK